MTLKKIPIRLISMTTKLATAVVLSGDAKFPIELKIIASWMTRRRNATVAKKYFIWLSGKREMGRKGPKRAKVISSGVLVHQPIWSAGKCINPDWPIVWV